MTETIIAAVIGAVAGGSGIVGLMFYYLKRYIDGKLKDREGRDRERREQHLRRLKIEDERGHAEGRLLFWMHRAIVTGHHNGDYAAAWEAFQIAEAKKKELDREIIVLSEMK